MLLRTMTLLALGAAAPATFAQPFAIDWHTFESGGMSLAGAYEIFGVIGQPDAGSMMTGGDFAVTGGFLTGPSQRRCTADFDDGTGTGAPDGGVTIDDLLYYLIIYADGLLRADLDNGTGTGTRDGGVTIDDLLYFLERYAAGC